MNEKKLERYKTKTQNELKVYKYINKSTKMKFKIKKIISGQAQTHVISGLYRKRIRASLHAGASTNVVSIKSKFQ